MKQLPSTLTRFLNVTPNSHRADLFAVSLPNGQTMYATDGQWDIPGPSLAGKVVTSVSVPGTARPWLQSGSLNVAFPFPGSSGTDPVQVAVTPGEFVSIRAGGLVSAGTAHWPYTGPIGYPYGMSPDGALTAVFPDQFPAQYIAGSSSSGPVLITGLMGAFVDVSGNVLVVIGIGGLYTVPPSAAFLNLGVNDINFGDNSGSYAVQVTVTPGATYKSSTYGSWSRGRIVSEAGTKLSANSMDLTCVPQPTTAYPGLNLGILNAALNHLFDGSDIRVYTAYMPIGSYGDVSAGIETKWRGFITRPTEIGRNKVVFECYDPFALLNLKVPARLFQATCPWSFADSNCTLAASDYTVAFTAASGSNQRTLTPVSAFSQAGGYFAQGVVTCLTGGNAGLSQTVKIHAGGVLTVMVPWLLPVAPGDTFLVIKGCDKTLSMCKATKEASGAVVDNSANFGGTPFLPVPQTAI
jgi:uncharacterized phage protein (TIGR02218 family)